MLVIKQMVIQFALDDYWANRYFKYYYELPEKTKIELVD